MLRISQIKMKPGCTKRELEEKIRKELRLSHHAPFSWSIVRKSLDARKKPELFEIYTVDVKLRNEGAFLKQGKNKHIQKIATVPYTLPRSGSRTMQRRPLVIGSGPAGLFCTYLLAMSGYHPLLLERGKPVEERREDVENFWKEGVLKPNSNVQFGEGGAGTFSDGKLNTLVKDKEGRCRFVLETFVKFGAPEEILYENKPHIGTDVLIDILKNMRKEIQRMGGEIRFNQQVTDFELSVGEQQKSLLSIEINGREKMPVETVVLAPGHSARDTFFTLYQKGVPMEAKAFAVGVRVEHSQEMIDHSQYGKSRGKLLPPASYKLTADAGEGRGVYTFCMCPGGYVVNASSEAGRLAINGMSYSGRGGSNANSAVVVTISPEDYGNNTPLDGIEFQRMLEEKAFLAGGGKIPVQCYGDFRRNQKGNGFQSVKPQMKGAFQLANLRDIFPTFLSDALICGIDAFEKKIKGFASEDTVLSAVESRTSSPVRILRNEQLESAVKGLYPCGEGAGYAGGISSAAMDGMKVAEAIMKRYAPLENSSYMEFTKN